METHRTPHHRRYQPSQTATARPVVWRAGSALWVALRWTSWADQQDDEERVEDADSDDDSEVGPESDEDDDRIEDFIEEEDSAQARDETKECPD